MDKINCREKRQKNTTGNERITVNPPYYIASLLGNTLAILCRDKVTFVFLSQLILIINFHMNRSRRETSTPYPYIAYLLGNCGIFKWITTANKVGFYGL